MRLSTQPWRMLGTTGLERYYCPDIDVAIISKPQLFENKHIICLGVGMDGNHKMRCRLPVHVGQLDTTEAYTESMDVWRKIDGLRSWHSSKRLEEVEVAWSCDSDKYHGNRVDKSCLRSRSNANTIASNPYILPFSSAYMVLKTVCVDGLVVKLS